MTFPKAHGAWGWAAALMTVAVVTGDGCSKHGDRSGQPGLEAIALDGTRRLLEYEQLLELAASGKPSAQLVKEVGEPSFVVTSEGFEHWLYPVVPVPLFGTNQTMRVMGVIVTITNNYISHVTWALGPNEPTGDGALLGPWTADVGLYPAAPEHENLVASRSQEGTLGDAGNTTNGLVLTQAKVFVQPLHANASESGELQAPVRVRVELDPALVEALKDFTGAHVGEKIVITINGESAEVVTVMTPVVVAAMEFNISSVEGVRRLEAALRKQ